MSNPKARSTSRLSGALSCVPRTQRDLLEEIYKTLVNDWKSENLELRGISALPSRQEISGNDVPDQAVDVLLSVCAKNAGYFSDRISSSRPESAELHP